MPKSVRLIKQVQRALTTLANDPRLDQSSRVTVTLSNILLNELLLREDTDFYLSHADRGRRLLTEGLSVVEEPALQKRARSSVPQTLTRNLSFQAIDAEIEKLSDDLAEVVEALDENRSAVEKDLVVRISKWESSAYQRRVAPAVESASSTRSGIDAQALQAYLREKFPESRTNEVTKFEKLEGGLSKMTVMFETRDDVFGHRSLVMRADQRSKLLHFDGSEVRREFYLLALVHKLGMPVPQPLWLEEDETKLGFRFLVSARGEGQNFVSGLASLGGGGARPPELIESVLRVLYQLHDLEVDPNDPLVGKSHLAEWMPYKTIRDVARYNATVYLPKVIARAGIRPTPQLLRALHWLERNVPDRDDPPVLVHNDFGFNNLLVKNNTVSAVLDWEVSRMGDPADDILWTQLSMSVYSMPEFIAIYNQATGRNVTEFRIAYAQLQRCVLHMIAGLTAMRCLDTDADAPLQMGAMAFNLMSQFGSDVSALIEIAETARSKPL